jgi:hypothetical protein
VPQQSRYELKRGSVIPATLITGINSDLPGRITAQVSQNVYDSATGHYLLVPQGTKLLGRYDNKVSFGQSRVLVVWTDMIFPNGSTLQLVAMAGTDAEGYGGFTDRSIAIISEPSARRSFSQSSAQASTWRSQKARRLRHRTRPPMPHEGILPKHSAVSPSGQSARTSTSSRPCASGRLQVQRPGRPGPRVSRRLSTAATMVSAVAPSLRTSL